jgi:hypothetical protein
MVLSLNAARLSAVLEDILAHKSGSIRAELTRFAAAEGIELS